jgi:threonine synthase
MVTVFVTHLKCFNCGEQVPMNPRAYLCPRCGDHHDDPGILDVCYDYASVRERLPFQGGGVFRYLPLLPVHAPGSVLAAGGTALIPVPRLASRWGMKALYLKDETRNPTRCLKDRATAVGMTLALECGARDVYCSSAGNAAISLAGFAAHAGLGCHVFVPSYASPVRLDWLNRFGADIHVSRGNYDQAFEEAERAGLEYGWFSRNCAFNPFLVEGKKTCALEIAEEITPDLVVAPVGDGCTLAALGKGFREARELGIIDRLPRLVGVQAAGVQPMVARFHGATAEEGETAASSIAVRHPRNALRLLAELKASEGEMVAVTDEQIQWAQGGLAREAGVIAEFTSASTLAGLAEMGPRVEGKVAVLVITGGRVD